MARGPLQRRRIVITRPRDRAERLAGELRALGAATLVLPLVRIEATEEVSALAAVLADLDGSDWVVFTSASGVSAVGELMTELGAAKVAAVGPATAAALRDIGVEPSFVPGRFAAEEIVAGLEPLAGARVLLPQADLADRGLADGLRDRGAMAGGGDPGAVKEWNRADLGDARSFASHAFAAHIIDPEQRDADFLRHRPAERVL